MTRLQVGDVFDHNQFKPSEETDEWVVWFVNSSCAKTAKLDSSIRHRTNENGKIQFLAADAENISPNSELKVIRKLGRKGLADYIDQRANEITETRKTNMKKAKTAKEGNEEGRKGKLGGWKGHSVTSVIRRLGELGWTLAEARQFFKDQKIDAADNTIKIQLRRGALKLQEGAKIQKNELEDLRPEIKEEPKKAKKADKAEKKAGKKADKPAKKNGKKAKKDQPDPEEADEEVEADADADEASDEEGEEDEGEE